MKALLYRPAPRRSLVVAFAAAAAIHVSALAFSPSRYAAAILPGNDDVTDIEFENPQAEPEQESPPVETTTSPLPTNQDEFAEEPKPTPIRMTKSATPIRTSRLATPHVQSRSDKLSPIQAPKPEYPYVARQHHITGSGIVMLDVDPASGSVVCANLIQSTGSPMLDNSALSAFRRWRFKNGTPSPVKVPFTFTMFGAEL